MNIMLVPWYTTVLVEANKFWVYALSISIIGTIWQLLFGSNVASTAQNADPANDEKKTASESPAASNPVTSTATLVNRIILGSLDLSLPTTFLGWSGLGNLGVGSAMVVSTVLAWPGAWESTQR